MNPIADTIRAHLSATGTSMRALSLELGQGEKFIADIISGKSKRPTPAALRKLSAVIGTDLAALPVQPQVTAADMEQMLRERPPAGWSTSKVSGARSALAWHVRAAGTGRPESTIIDRAKGRAWLSGTTAAAQGLAPNTFTTYASHLRDLFDLAGATTRPRQIRDVTGPWRQIYDALADAREYETAVAGPFFAWCDGAGLAIGDVRSESFTDYLAARLASGRVTMSESKHRETAMEALSLWNRLAGRDGFRAMGVRAVVSPFPDGRDRYGMPEELLAPLLEEFDTCVLPWARGETGPDGTLVDTILDRLDPVAVEAVDPRKKKLQAYLGKQTRTRRQEREDRLRAAGVLLGDACWKANTAANARAAIKSLAMALWSQTEIVITSIHELTDPEVLEAAATALDEATDEKGIGSSYLETVLKRVMKLAGGFVKRSAEDLVAIETLVKSFEPDFAGIAPRNRTKLQQLTAARVDRFLRMSGEIIAEVNREVARRRRSATAAGPGKPGIDADLAALLEVAMAHDIMLARAPRPGNLLAIDLAAHVRRRADGGITIELPPEMVKTKVALAIPLGERQSEFCDSYVAKVRPALLTAENCGNTMLFPARRSHDGSCSTLTKRLIDEVHRRVGIRIHPHLYRHIVGWIWLRKDPNALPAVQKLLGHKRLETTMKFYAELDETLALQQWADHLEAATNDTAAPTSPRRRDRGRPGPGGRAAA
ncbi:tyrosine-type recombinase/integrase [uncultured Amaricoccus sp.]|uniref:tyrosine-type recombinase/integrase n=1 Tax=uncultured Amaricoccus sp. TaxID=339341 RepID=UPI0026039345|nr:site-specific integrase [uncultured Amaricoccus sp.]